MEYLEKAGVFNLLYAGTSGKKILRKPQKIYLENTNLVHLVKDNVEIGSHHVIPLWIFGMMY